MSYAEYRRRRHRTARIAIAIALGIMCTIGVSLWIALRGSISVHIDPYAMPWVVTGYSGFGMSGTCVDHRRRLFDPDAGDVFAPDIVAEDNLSFGWPCRALGYRVVDANRLTSLERLFATPIKTRDSLYKSYIIGGIWRDAVSVHPDLASTSHIPFSPRPLGFTINTLLAAMPLYLLLGGWTDLRSFVRMRKGRCPRCGYDARGLPACPECGLESPPTPPRAQHTNICHLAICHVAISPEGP